MMTVMTVYILIQIPTEPDNICNMAYSPFYAAL